MLHGYTPPNRFLPYLSWTQIAELPDKENTEGFTRSRNIEQVRALEKALSGEVMMHLEFLRTKEGEFNCSGLQVIRYTTEERLNEIMAIYREHGVQIKNPHVYVVEDGKQNILDPKVL